MQEPVHRVFQFRSDAPANRAAVINTGTSVTASSAAKNIEKVFV
ncbi:MAG: hypothetical protein QM796_20055 [Chthoniobacteraceae bacterium]